MIGTVIDDIASMKLGRGILQRDDEGAGIGRVVVVDRRQDRAVDADAGIALE